VVRERDRPEPILAHESSAELAPLGAVELADVERRAFPQRSVGAASEPEPLLVCVVDQDGLVPPMWWVDVSTDGPEVPSEDPTWPRSSGLMRAQRIAARVSPRTAGLELSLRGGGEVTAEITAELRARAPRLVLQAKAFREAGVRYAESEPFVLDTSTRGPITLVVADPTMLVVRVEGPRPAGDLRFDVAPAALLPGANVRSADFAIVPDGEASFRVTHGVPYRVRVSGADPDDVIETSIAGIERGRQFGVFVHFPAGFSTPVPFGYAEVALAGRVEFEGADRPGLWASVDGGLPISIPVRAEGRFELMHLRGKSVELHAAGDEFEARFDPEVSTHPFGTRDVVVKSRPSAPRVLVRLHFVAAENGAPVTDAVVSFLRRDGDRLRGKNQGSQSRSEVDVSLPVFEDIEMVVCSRDRRDMRGPLFPGGIPATGVTFERTLRLERGFRREFRVIHCSLHTPIADADVALDGHYLGRSDAEGRVQIELDEWPSRLTIRAAGFDEGQWPPAWQTPLASTTMTLCPVD